MDDTTSTTDQTQDQMAAERKASEAEQAARADLIARAHAYFDTLTTNGWTPQYNANGNGVINLPGDTPPEFVNGEGYPIYHAGDQWRVHLDGRPGMVKVGSQEDIDEQNSANVTAQPLAPPPMPITPTHIDVAAVITEHAPAILASDGSGEVVPAVIAPMMTGPQRNSEQYVHISLFRRALNAVENELEVVKHWASSL